MKLTNLEGIINLLCCDFKRQAVYPFKRLTSENLIIKMLLLGALFLNTQAAANPINDESASLCGPNRSIDEAKGFKVQKNIFKGLKRTSLHVVHREMLKNNREGKVTNCNELQKQAKLFKNLDIFAKINFRVEALNQDTLPSVNIVFDFIEIPTILPYLAIKKTSQDGTTIGPGIASLNFLGQDIRLDGIFRAGGKKGDTREFLAFIETPWIGPLPIQFDGLLIQLDSYNVFDEFPENSLRLVLNSKWPNRSPVKLGVSFEYLKMNAPDLILKTKTKDNLIGTGPSIIWDKRDGIYNPTSGHYLEAKVLQYFLDVDYLKYTLDSRVYYSIKRHHTLALSQLFEYKGTLTGKDAGKYDDYHIGGANSLRGFRSNSQAGANQHLISAEYRYTLLPEQTVSLWGLSAYLGLQSVIGLDYGQVWEGQGFGSYSNSEKPYAGLWAAINILIPGVERLRIEYGSNILKADFAFSYGLYDKAYIQRLPNR